jgi:low affinity Fe/Cu permease
VFLIQYTQNRDARAMHLKLDELLRSVHGARTEMVNLKDMSDDELRRMEMVFDRLARFAARSRAPNGAHIAADVVDAVTASKTTR